MASSAVKAEGRGRLIGPGDPAAIEIEGAGPPILGIHGFGGTPLEVGLVAEVARALGRRACLPLLPGHGTHADDLSRMRWDDWARAVDAALERETEPAIVVGLSLGSLLATHLAVTRPERVRALVLLANAFWLTAPFPAWALRAVHALGLPDFRLPKVAADIADPDARRTHLTYGEQPVHAAVAVERAGARMRRRLPEVQVPTLIVHGARDRVCPVANAERVASRLGSRDVRVVILPRSRHIVTRDLERTEVAAELRRFVERF
ncbi:MAG: alpha/beta fold hydrolase [Polyangiaceae bacterium]|nr:alpha/beta fold hydrolase [Polyangiaceae bacterium]